MTTPRDDDGGSGPTRIARAQPLAERPLTLPHEARLSHDDERYQEILGAHALALQEDRPGYLDPGTGLFVLTAAYLAARGYCCENGCRHCPYLE